MSGEMWRIVIAVFLCVHGVGHVGGYWMFLTSWLSPPMMDPGVKWVCIGLWLVAMVVFLAAGLGLWQGLAWWRGAAITASLLSLAVSVLYLPGVPLNAAIADVVILVALLLVKFPPAELVGA